MPAVTARRLPGGNTWYEYHVHSANGLALSTDETYTTTTGTVGVRTTTYTYDANGVDLLEVRGDAGQLKEKFTYNANHQIACLKEFVGEKRLHFIGTCLIAMRCNTHPAITF